MKLVMAIIKPFKLDDVREALAEVGVQGITVTEVKGFGRQKGHTELYRGAEYVVDFLPKIKLEIAVPDSHRRSRGRDDQHAANSGKIGDGKIFVYDLDQVIRIRTGETGRRRALRQLGARSEREPDADAPRRLTAADAARTSCPERAIHCRPRPLAVPHPSLLTPFFIWTSIPL